MLACLLVQAKLGSNDLSAALPIVLLLESITQKQPALLSSYLPQLKECMASFAGAHSLKISLGCILAVPCILCCSSFLGITQTKHSAGATLKESRCNLPGCDVLYCDALWGAVLLCAGLSSDTAVSLLLAVWPLCRVRSDLQDFVVMLLRKMMYRQDVDGR
jgi:hypothetical protein